jgi:hypothetical protein
MARSVSASHRSWLFAALLVGLMAAMAVLHGGQAASAQTAGSGLTFGAPSIVDPVRTYGEPDVRISPDGSWYVSGPWGTGTQRSIWNRSVDGGRTFRPLHERPILSAFESDSQISGPGGGDTEIAIDHTGKVYYADLAALVTLKTATWDNATRRMTTGVIANGKQNINGFDRQWFALWDPADPAAARAASGYTGPFPVNYLTFAEAGAGLDCSGNCAAATYSLDGVTYSDSTLTWELANDGNLAIDPLTGTVFEGISVNSTGDVGVAILTRDPALPADPALRSARIVKAADLPAGMQTRALFPVVSLDAARNLYLVWVTRDDTETAAVNPAAWQIWYSVASAASGWSTWSAPRQVSSGPARTNIMPWAVAGAAGRLAVAWYGTDDATHDPSGQDAHQAWDVYLAMVANAAAPSYTVQQVKVTPRPMHYGTICLAGTLCAASAGNRNLADFFQVTMDPSDGAVVIVYDDTSNELTQNVANLGEIPPPVDGAADHRGAPVVTVIRQNGGVGLLGTVVSGPAAVSPQLSDPMWDALFDPVFGTASVNALDLRSVSVKSDGADLVFRLAIGSADFRQALAFTGSNALQYVIRWSGPTAAASTGTRNPLYYVAVEVGPLGIPSYFAGLVQSVELCSVSGCFPHLLEYPRPPFGGAFVSGELVVKNAPQASHFLIRVPRFLLGNPADGAVLGSFSAYSFARTKSAGIPVTNAEAQAGILPVEVDGACCSEAVVGPGSP